MLATGLVLLFVASLSFFYLNKDTVKDIKQENNLNTFVSQRVPLSFDYPEDFPIAVAKEKWINTKYLDQVKKEAVDFSEEYLPNSGSDSYGYIGVYTSEITNLRKYLEDRHTSKSIDELIIEEVNLEHASGYRVKTIRNSDYGDPLGPIAEYTYYFYNNELVYQIALTNPSYLDSDPVEIKKIFDDIILPSLKIE